MVRVGRALKSGQCTAQALRPTGLRAASADVSTLDSQSQVLLSSLNLNHTC